MIAECGVLKTIDKLRTFAADGTKSEAIRVIATTEVPTSVAGGLWNLFSKGDFETNTKLMASAVGTAPKGVLAQISIGSTLVKISTKTQASLLNEIFGALAGGTLDLSVGDWNGLIDAHINLLSFMDQLALDLNITAGDYDTLLSTDTTLTQLIKTTLTVANANGPTADLKNALDGIEAAVKVNPVLITLGDLLNLQTGTKSSGLDTNLQLTQLIQGFLQVANTHQAVDLNTSIVLPGLANVTLRMKVIEPPQFSSIGDPSSGQTISVRTAQVRSLISIDLTGLNKLLNLPDAIKGLSNTLTTALNDLLGLNLVGLVTNLLCLDGCKQISPLLLPDPKIYISLDAGGAKAEIIDYSCPNGGSGIKSLTVKTGKSLAELKIGKINPDTAFSSPTTPSVSAVPIIDIGIQTCYKILGLLGECKSRVAYAGGGIGVMAQSNLLETPESILVFSKDTVPDTTPPNLKLLPAIQRSPSSTAIVNGLTETISGVKLKPYKPAVNNIFSTVLTTAIDAISAVGNILDSVIKNLLSPLLSPLIENLLTTLGINLLDVQVGANLSCGQGGRAQLVM